MDKIKDKIFKIGLFISALSILLLMAGILYSLIVESLPTFEHFGFFNFISSSEWNPSEGNEKYGALSFIVGTTLTAGLALLICIPFSLALSLFRGDYYNGGRIATGINQIIHLFANIPSILWGVWGYFCLRPILISFNVGTQGFGIFTASFVLAIMIIPYAASLNITFISKIPQNIKEAAYSLGATHSEMLQKVGLPLVKKGIFASYLFALGKALGETMIVMLLVGNINHIPESISDTGNTITGIIVNQIGAAGQLKLSSLFALALLLFLMTSIVNFAARQMMRKSIL